jgi:hypothetical protein
LTKYVTDYMTKKGAACTQGFARCFLDDIQQSTTSCGTIAPAASTAPSPQLIPKAEDFYVAYAIYAINQAFNTYSLAITAANGLASELVPAVIELLDPPKQLNILLNDLFTALSVGLSFLAPESTIINTMVQGALQIASVGKFLFPEGTADSQVQELASVDQALEGVVTTLQGDVNDVVPVILNDVNNFVTFSGTGQFSQLTQESVFNDTRGLLTGLVTYIISQAMQLNKVVLSRSPQGYDVNSQVASDHQTSDYKISGCGHGYDAVGVCETWYFNTTTEISYSFVNLDNPSHNFNQDMESIFAQNKWTTPDLLIMAAERCAAAGHSQQPGNLISAIPGGPYADCLSNMQVYD